MQKVNNIRLFDIGGTNIVSCLYKDGKYIDWCEKKVDKKRGSESIAEILKDILDESSKFEGISIAAPGVIDSSLGKVMRCTDTIKDYLGFDFFKVLERYNCPIIIDNDLNVAALGEFKFSKHTDSMVQINIGTGVGAALIQNGKVCRGFHQTAGEIGNIKFKNSILDDIGSTRGMLERINQRGIPIKNGKEAISKMLNQHVIQEEFNVMCDSIAYVISLIHLIIDPKTVVIGGGISEMGEELIDMIYKHLKEYLIPAYMKDINIVSAISGNKAGIYGALENYKVRVGKYD